MLSYGPIRPCIQCLCLVSTDGGRVCACKEDVVVQREDARRLQRAHGTVEHVYVHLSPLRVAGTKALTRFVSDVEPALSRRPRVE